MGKPKTTEDLKKEVKELKQQLKEQAVALEETTKEYAGDILNSVQSDKDAKVEGSKELLRNTILGVLSTAGLTGVVGVDTVTNNIEMLIPLVAVAVLKGIDKFVHTSKKIKAKGILPF